MDNTFYDIGKITGNHKTYTAIKGGHMRKIDVSNFFPCTVGELVEALEDVDPGLLVFFDSKRLGTFLNPTVIEIYADHVDIVDVFEE